MSTAEKSIAERLRFEAGSADCISDPDPTLWTRAADEIESQAKRITELEKAQSLFKDSEFFKVCQRVVDLERLRDSMRRELERRASPPPASGTLPHQLTLIAQDMSCHSPQWFSDQGASMLEVAGERLRYLEERDVSPPPEAAFDLKRANEIGDAIVQRICDSPDHTSPDDDPQLLCVYPSELHTAVVAELENEFERLTGRSCLEQPSTETPAPQCKCTPGMDWHCPQAEHMKACTCACHKRLTPPAEALITAFKEGAQWTRGENTGDFPELDDAARQYAHSVAIDALPDEMDARTQSEREVFEIVHRGGLSAETGGSR